MLRRPFGGRRGPLGPGPKPLEVRAIQALRRAHRMMEMGEFEQALAIFLRLAEGAVRLGMPLRAAPLYVQAAHARLEMGNAAEAVELAQRGIRLLAQAGRVERVRAITQQLIGLLEERGFYEQAVALRAEVTALLGNAQPSGTITQRGQLPTRCPACNGPVRADQVEWVDAYSAVCAFCGSTIQCEAS